MMQVVQKEKWFCCYKKGVAFPKEDGVFVSLLARVISWQECQEIAQRSKYPLKTDTLIIIAKHSIEAHKSYILMTS